jgi:hypothetical protein
MDEETPEQMRAAVAADWRVEATLELLTKATEAPELRYPAITSAMALAIPLARFPRASLAWIGDFLFATKSWKGHDTSQTKPHRVSSALVVEIIQAPHLFDEKDSERLIQRIKSDRGLMQSALEHPRFTEFPNARLLCIEALRHKSAALANYALEVLSNHWPDEIDRQVETLAKRAKSPSRILRRSIATALGYSKSSSAEAEIRRLLTDPERVVRKAAVAAIVQMKGADAASDLLLCLRDPAPLVRIEACCQIATLKDTSLLMGLLECSDDVSGPVRRAALHALEQIDRDLALRSFATFTKDGLDLRRDLIEPEGGKAQTAEDSNPDEIDSEQAIMELEHSDLVGFNVTDALRRIIFAKQLFADVGNSDDLELLLKVDGANEQDSLTQLFGGLLGNLIRPWTPAKLTNHLIEISPTSEAAQAFLIGILGSARLQEFFPTSGTRRLRENGDDTLFQKVVDVFGPCPRSLRWPVSRATLGDTPLEDEPDRWFDADDVWLAELILDGLRTWALIRAEPEHLGFLLACSGPALWKRIPLRFELSAESTALIQAYGARATSEDVIVAIQRGWFAGQLHDESPEVRLLAGMGDRGMALVAKYGQRTLFGNARPIQKTS